MTATDGSTDPEAQPRRARHTAGGGGHSPGAPVQELEWAHTGTGFFARHLDALTDAELAEPSLLPGWTRAAVVAHVAYNARALSRLCAWARTGVETPMYASFEQRNAEIDEGARLPAQELRELFGRSADLLHADWDELTDDAWDAVVRTAQGRPVPCRETAWMRNREVWIHAVDLDSGGSFRDLPPAVVDRLTEDVLGAWRGREEAVDLVLAPDDRGERIVVGAGEGPTVVGSAADLARWLTGRDGHRLESSTGTLPDLPRWL
ncbi:maleylpyruvate isomerase family mycothiol-dependent enzyme [Georgenia sp. H159]|uniref:maleylpyruvate isomerase family mycothiol-dependent enzyme n=1 Tax=Georgenia sp. H159 TaxID=3076115 RepID=UPI002D776C1B|nr:maleylpyruvate isomerase family mycothiol-dependent enzyme [Georgenia sp. H159]